LIDYGVAVNIIDNNLIEKHQLPTVPCIPPLRGTAVNNQPIGEGYLNWITTPLKLTIGLFHAEQFPFYILESPANPIILELPWLQLHDPHISWRNKELTHWLSHCQNTCFTTAQPCPCLITSVESPETNTTVTLPQEFCALQEGFTTVMVTIDRFSKACKPIPLKGLPTALETATTLFHHVFRNYGLPEDIVSNRGPQFKSQQGAAPME
ncbi:hypothetical protein QTP86_001813, partial [Hemibagrus guttatus]